MASNPHSENGPDRPEEIDRRQFFKAAGRGTAALGGMIVVGGAGLTMLSSGCGDDDPIGTNGYG